MIQSAFNQVGEANIGGKSDAQIRHTIANFFTINNIEHLTNSYISRLNVYPLNSLAKTISLSFQDNNAVKTADVLTALANEYIVYDIEERSKSSKKESLHGGRIIME